MLEARTRLAVIANPGVPVGAAMLPRAEPSRRAPSAPGRQGDRDDPAGRDRMTNAHDQVSVASGRRLRHATRDAKLQQRAVTETGRAMFRSMPPVVRLRILGRLEKLAADAKTA
jgi:hypothetical protein